MRDTVHAAIGACFVHAAALSAQIHATWDSRNVLSQAILLNDVESAKLLIESKAPINARLKDGRTNLMLAAALNRVELVRLLIAARANLLVAQTPDPAPAASMGANRLRGARAPRLDGGMTALAHAIASGSVDCIRELIAAKADLNSAPAPVGVGVGIVTSEETADSGKVCFTLCLTHLC